MWRLIAVIILLFAAPSCATPPSQSGAGWKAPYAPYNLPRQQIQAVVTIPVTSTIWSAEL